MRNSGVAFHHLAGPGPRTPICRPTLRNPEPNPAKLVLVGGGGLATFRISPNFTDPQKTAIVLPGADNAALVTMQYSTNLVDWFPATNGVYAGDVAKFFKIHLEKSKP